MKNNQNQAAEVLTRLDKIMKLKQIDPSAPSKKIKTMTECLP